MQVQFIYPPNEKYLLVPDINRFSKRQIPNQTPKTYDTALLTSTNHLFVNRNYIPSGLMNGFDNKQLSFKKKFFLYFKSRFVSATKFHKGYYIWVYDYWSKNYYHWLCEALPRIVTLWKQNKENVVIVPDIYKNISFISQSLSSLNLPYLWIDTKITNVFEKLSTIQTQDFIPLINPNLQLELKDSIFASIDVKIHSVASRKVYLSRANAARRRLLNEEEILPVLKDYGYEVVFAEELSFVEQVKLFANTSSFISLHGAGLTNLMFMPLGSKVMEIRYDFLEESKKNLSPYCYFQLANIFKIEWTFCNAMLAESNTNSNDVVIDVNVFKTEVSNFENHQSV